MTNTLTHSPSIADVVSKNREGILRLAEKYGAFNIRLFGSVARGEARSDSDIDLLVDFRSDYRLLDHAGLVNDLEELLGRKVEVAIAANLREEYRASILKDARPL